jgi:hypothetical protein
MEIDVSTDARRLSEISKRKVEIFIPLFALIFDFSLFFFVFAATFRPIDQISMRQDEKTAYDFYNIMYNIIKNSYASSVQLWCRVDYEVLYLIVEHAFIMMPFVATII